MCLHNPGVLSCQRCIDEWKAKSNYMSERGKKGYAAKVAAGYTFRPYAGRRRCKECQVFTTETRCSTCKRPTRALPVMARHRIHYVDQNVDSLPRKRASKFSHARGEPFCKHCGEIVEEDEIYRRGERVVHKECFKQVRFKPIPSNRPNHLKVNMDSLPK